MIVSQTRRRSNSRWLQTRVLLCALIVLPLGIASAQDYKAVERRLGEAVADGEISLEQAGIMMDALRKASGAKKSVAKSKSKSKNESKSDADLESAWQKLQSMVQAGEITQEQATAKMSAIKKEAAKRDTGSDRIEAYLMEVKKELGDVVEAGKISKEDAVKKFEAARKKIKERVTNPNTPTGSKRITREDYAKAKAKIRDAIARGRITEEQGQAKLAAMSKMMDELSKGATEKSKDWEGIKRRIEDAVKSGKMTGEEADARPKELREESGQKVKKKGAKDKGGE